MNTYKLYKRTMPHLHTNCLDKKPVGIVFYFCTLTIKNTDSLSRCAHQQPITLGFQSEHICAVLFSTVTRIGPIITQPNEKHCSNTETCFIACTSVDYKVYVYEQESCNSMLHWGKKSHTKCHKNNNRCTTCSIQS